MIQQQVAHKGRRRNQFVPDGKRGVVSSADSNNSSMSENYSALLQAFHETHEEANRLAG